MRRLGQLGTLSQQLKALDAYPKIAEDFRIKTLSGAAISIISALVIFILVISEFRYYWASERVDHLRVDTARKGKLQINFDVTFHRMGCDVINVGAVDVSGEHYNSAEHDITKRELSQDSEDSKKQGALGSLFGRKAVPEEKKHVLGEDEKMAAAMKEALKPRPEGYCGSCYGSEAVPGQCCNTCKEVENSYRLKGWAFTPTEEIEQCVRDALERKLQRSKHLGCNIRGTMTVNKVAGNIHFVPGRMFQSLYGMNQEFLPSELLEFNMSHTINSLGFGKQYPGIVNPLDSVTEAVEKGTAQFQYFVKVVPTDYKVSGRQVDTNQYSVTQHTRVAQDSAHMHFNPGVFIVYDMSPVRVSISQRNKSFASFLTGVCAIVGGVFTVAGMFDAAVYHGWNTIKKKVDLGKSM